MTGRNKWICTRCIRTEHGDGKSMVTKPEQVLGTCSYCAVENWIFEVVGDVPAKTIADMPELKVEKPKKRKKREVGESIPEGMEAAIADVRAGRVTKIDNLDELDEVPEIEAEEVPESIPDPIEELKHGISEEKAEAVIELMEEPSDAEYAKVTKLITEEEKELVEKSLEDMTEDELRARLAELEKK